MSRRVKATVVPVRMRKSGAGLQTLASQPDLVVSLGLRGYKAGTPVGGADRTGGISAPVRRRAAPETAKVVGKLLGLSLRP